MMQKVRHFTLAACVAALLGGCADVPPAPAVIATRAPALSGERLTYVVGCVHCHHQLPKQVMNAPSLVLAQTYSLAEFKTLLAHGMTRDGRDLYAQRSAMGWAAREQLSYLTEDEVGAIHRFLQQQWTADRAAAEEAKLTDMPPPPPGPGA